MAVDYLQKILTAKVYDVAIESPLDLMPTLSRRIGNRVLLKREDQQPVFSFKLRGAYNKMAQLSVAERARGVITASAGNHAQGVALAAQRLSCKATIVMPITTPKIKIQAVETRGAKVVLHGDSFSDAYAHALKLQKAQRATFVHPYDDPDVIAGQGTIAVEILRQLQAPIDAIFVAIGGGGLISGVATALKACNPTIEVIGVESSGAPGMTRSVREGRLLTLDTIDCIIDGLRVKRVGEKNYEIVRQYVDDLVTLPDEQIFEAVVWIMSHLKVVPEGAAAAPVAALLEGLVKARPGTKIVCVLSGGNVNLEQLRGLRWN